MRFSFFLVICYFLFENSILFGQADPTVIFSPGVPSRLMGVGNISPSSRIFNCEGLLTKGWAYPNAQATAICNEAEISCVRWGMIRQELEKQKQRGAESKNLEKTVYLTQDDTQMKLEGCKNAIESTLSGYRSVLEASGFSAF